MLEKGTQGKEAKERFCSVIKRNEEQCLRITSYPFLLHFFSIENVSPEGVNLRAKKKDSMSED